MRKQIVRAHGRASDKIRSITVTHNAFGYAPGSVLFEMGNTKVLCAVSLSQGVPPFLKGSKTGWLNADYSMLPTATHIRRARATSSFKRDGRSIEISRLIGRSLRTVVDLNQLGERTISIDCDVLQADGGTRTACISGAFLALCAAQQAWLASGELKAPIIIDSVAAISVGITKDTILVDLDYEEDSTIDADYNFVLTQTNRVIEMQGAAEQKTISWDQLHEICQAATHGVKQLFEIFESLNIQHKVSQSMQKTKKSGVTRKKHVNSMSMFSIGNRLQQ